MMLAEFQLKALRRGSLTGRMCLNARALEELCPEGMPEATTCGPHFITAKKTMERP